MSKMMLVEQKWNYKGFKCHIYCEQEYEDNFYKAFHMVTKPDGKKVIAPLDSYDTNRELLEDYIDLGFPDRISSAPLNKYDIALLKRVSGI